MEKNRFVGLILGLNQNEKKNTFDYVKSLDYRVSQCKTKNQKTRKMKRH